MAKNTKETVSYQKIHIKIKVMILPSTDLPCNATTYHHRNHVVVSACHVSTF